ncbi:MAG TPA: RagB/SusD family nutrient uptake outer membrane protein [Gemmatimonadales bacterium]|nr:RagB/SusD family nutrient uptake outer membrane protein [Gemmatimonadales bacterium]
MRTRRFAIAASLLALAACNFDILNTNQPTLDDLLNHPTRSKVATVATGLFSGARSDIQAFIWRAGSMGREGINLSGNNQPDFQEPYFGPVQGGGSFGGTLYAGRYANIRTANIFLAMVARNADAATDPVQGMSAADKAAARGMANTLKALAFVYVVELRAQLGAPVDVDISIDAPPALFVSEDSVYRYIVGLLDSARADLVRAGTFPFPFAIPPGFSGATTNALDFSTPKKFIAFNRALAAKANVLRATDGTACKGSAATCYGAALTALGASFLSAAPADLQKGAYFDFSSGQGDQTNGLSEPLSALTFFALTDNIADADTQPMPGRVKDQRVLDKIAPATQTQTGLLGSIPIPGTVKFTLYMTNGAADEGHAIPIIKDEELLLLRAEASWFTGAKAAALNDLNVVRQNSGKLAPSTVTAASTDAQFVTALQYERRYSLLWEQGARWIDARRFGRLSGIPTDIPPSFGTPGRVPPVMPIPKSECDARNLVSSEVIPGVVTCTPTLVP